MADAPTTTPEIDAEDQTDDFDYDVKIEDAGPAKKKLTITVPADAVDDKIDTSFETLASEATLPGFRRGRAPRKLIERRFGSSVRDETRNQIIADAYTKAIEKNQLETLGDPEADDLADIELVPGQPFTFTVEIEVAPEFELPELEGMELKKPMVTVTDKHVEDELTRQLYRFGEPGDLEGEMKAGDRMRGRALVTDKETGDVIDDLPEAVIGIPIEVDGKKGHVLGLFVEDMPELFKGKKVGDTITIEKEASGADERPDIRGKTLKIEFTINDGLRVTPADVSDVVEIYGMDNEDDLKAEIRKALEERAAEEQQAAMREQVAAKLAETIDIELPENMSAKQAARDLDRQRVEMLYRGISADEVETRIAELRDASEEQSRKRLKLFFILNKLAKHFDVSIDEREVNGRIAQMAAARNARPEQLRAQFAQNGQLQQIALQIREHKAMDRVIDTAKVEEISSDEWNKIVEEEQKKAK